MGQDYCSMTPAGYIKDPSLISTIKLGDYLTSNSSQSVVHHGQIHSLAKTVADNPDNMPGLSMQIKSDLSALLSPYLDNLEVDVRPMAIQENNVDTFDYNILISVAFSGSNGRVTLAHSLLVKDAKIAKIARVTSV